VLWSVLLLLRGEICCSAVGVKSAENGANALNLRQLIPGWVVARTRV